MCFTFGQIEPVPEGDAGPMPEMNLKLQQSF
jgi:hypothetical protein